MDVAVALVTIGIILFTSLFVFLVILLKRLLTKNKKVE